MSFWDGTRWVREVAVRRTPRARFIERLGALLVAAVTVMAVLLPLVPFSSTEAAGPVLTVSPGSAPAGTKVNIVGTQFPARTKVQLEWDGSTSGMPGASVNGYGRFSVGMTVPRSATGTHTLAAVSVLSQKGGKAALVATVLASASFTVAAFVSPTPTLSATTTPYPTATPTATPAPTPTATPQLTPTPSATVTTTATPIPTATPTPSATLSVIPTPAPTSPPASVTSGFVARCGSSLCLDGRDYRFTGLNIYNANSRSNCWYTLGSGSGLDSSLTSIGSGEEVFRAWFFQRLATTDGVRDWSAFDHTLAVAAAHGERVIATLTNQWGDCENVSDSPVYKAEAWYQSGYKSAVDAGMATTYRQWVADVVTRYRNNPAILAWQMINEGEAKTSATGMCSSTAEASVDSWAVDISGLIKSIDSNHLVSLGTIGNGQCGTSTGTSYQDLHAISTIDLCEYHDYDSPTSPMPGDQWNGLATRLSQCQARGKPMFVGEMGIKTNAVSSLSTRAADIEEKFATQFAAGVVGELPWEWAASGQDSGDGYSIGPSDPILGLFGRY